MGAREGEMMDREKVIRGLECCIPMTLRNGLADCGNCPYDRKITIDGGLTECCHDLMTDALALLKQSFTPKEVYDTVIEHGQHDMRFKLGDKIDYSFMDVVDILNMELMCKAGDM